MSSVLNLARTQTIDRIGQFEEALRAGGASAGDGAPPQRISRPPLPPALPGAGPAPLGWAWRSTLAERSRGRHTSIRP